MSSAAAPEPSSLSVSARVAELFERHGRMTYGICRAMLRDIQEAEDATQQAFLSAHRALLGGARVRDEGAWIATIARNECRARITAAMRAPLPVSGEDIAEIPDAIDYAESRLHAGELRSALARLPERQREAVILRYVYGLRYGEVARALGLSRPATEALLFRARRAMRVRLRHAVGAALVVPLSVREELALALPGFEAQAGSGAAAAGVAGGVLAKLASAPAAAKLATATVAVSAVGVVGGVESDRPVPGLRADARLVAEPRDEAAASGSSHFSEDRGEAESDSEGDVSGRSGGSGAHDSDGEGRQGRDPGSSHESDDPAREPSGGSGTDGRDDEPADDIREPEPEHAGSSGPGSGEVDKVDDPDSGSSSGPSYRSDSPGSGSDDPDERGDGSESSGSGSSGSESEDDSSGSGSDHEPDAEDP